MAISLALQRYILENKRAINVGESILGGALDKNKELNVNSFIDRAISDMRKFGGDSIGGIFSSLPSLGDYQKMTLPAAIFETADDIARQVENIGALSLNLFQLAEKENASPRDLAMAVYLLNGAHNSAMMLFLLLHVSIEKYFEQFWLESLKLMIKCQSRNESALSHGGEFEKTVKEICVEDNWIEFLRSDNENNVASALNFFIINWLESLDVNEELPDSNDLNTFFILMAIGADGQKLYRALQNVKAMHQKTKLQDFVPLNPDFLICYDEILEKIEKTLIVLIAPRIN